MVRLLQEKEPPAESSEIDAVFSEKRRSSSLESEVFVGDDAVTGGSGQELQTLTCYHQSLLLRSVDLKGRAFCWFLLSSRHHLITGSVFFDPNPARCLVKTGDGARRIRESNDDIVLLQARWRLEVVWNLVSLGSTRDCLRFLCQSSIWESSSVVTPPPSRWERSLSFLLPSRASSSLAGMERNSTDARKQPQPHRRRPSSIRSPRVVVGDESRLLLSQKK